MDNLYDEMKFISTLKKCGEQLIAEEKNLYAIHRQNDVELVITLDFHKDGRVTMFVDEQPIEVE